MRRRIVMLITTLALSTMMLAGCGNGKNNNSVTSSATQEPEAEKTAGPVVNEDDSDYDESDMTGDDDGVVGDVVDDAADVVDDVADDVSVRTRVNGLGEGPGFYPGLQLRDGEFYRTAAASRCRVHDIEPLHGNIQVYLYPGTVHCKGAHAADGMSCKINDFLRCQHFGFRMKILLIFVIVDLGVPCCHDEHTDIIHLEGQGLGNLRRDDTHRVGRQLHRSAGLIKLLNFIFIVPLL